MEQFIARDKYIAFVSEELTKCGFSAGRKEIAVHWFKGNREAIAIEEIVKARSVSEDFANAT